METDIDTDSDSPYMIVLHNLVTMLVTYVASLTLHDLAAGVLFISQIILLWASIIYYFIKIRKSKEVKGDQEG